MVNLWDVAILKCQKIFGNPTKNTPWTFDPNNSPHSLDFAMFYRGKIRLGVFEWLLQKAWVAPHEKGRQGYDPRLGELAPPPWNLRNGNELHSQNDQPYLKPERIDFRRVLSFGWYRSEILGGVSSLFIWYIYPLGNDHISQPWETGTSFFKKECLTPNHTQHTNIYAAPLEPATHPKQSSGHIGIFEIFWAFSVHFWRGYSHVNYLLKEVQLLRHASNWWLLWHPKKIPKSKKSFGENTVVSYCNKIPSCFHKEHHFWCG